jgi:hypothetical protein
MNNWTSVSESLPDLNQMVLVCYPSASDGKPTYAWGARCEDAEGWAWATGGRYGIRLDKDAFGMTSRSARIVLSRTGCRFPSRHDAHHHAPPPERKTRCVESAADVLRRNPTTGIEGCCARATRAAFCAVR